MKVFYRILSTCLAAVTLLSCSGGDTRGKGTISSLEDLNGRTISVLTGSIQDLLATKSCPNSTILRSATETDIYMMAESGKASAVLTSSISWSMARSAYKNIIDIGVQMDPQPIGFAFCKEKSELRDRFNSFLEKYLAETDMEQSVKEWTDKDSNKQMPDPDGTSGENGTLHFAASAITPPFVFVKDGEVAGLEPEILAKFALSQNMKWDFTLVTFSGLINYIQSGKADAGCSIMSITPERQESIDFSIPWNTEYSTLLVNKDYAPAEFLTGVSTDDRSEKVSLKESFHKTLIKENRYKLLLNGLEATILISILSALFGTLIGILLCFASMHHNRIVSKSSDIFTGFMSCMPQVVFLMIMFYIVFGKTDISGQWVSIIAFSLCFGAYTSGIFKSCIKSIDKGQTEAALSLGFGKVRAFTNVILPQAFQRALPLFKGEFIGLVKATSIVGYIAVFDLTQAGDIIRSRTYEAFFPLIIVTVLYFIIIGIFSLILKYIGTKSQPKRKKFYK